jgi:pentatricopeptide repeat protein
MRISSRIDGSICGAILFLHRPSLSSNRSAAATSLPVFAHSPGGGPAQGFHSGCTPRRTIGTTAPRSRSSVPRRRPLLTLPVLRVSRTRLGSPSGPSIPASRVNHTAAVSEPPLEPFTGPEFDDDIPPDEPTTPNPPSPQSRPRRSFPKKELLALIDPYDAEEIGTVDDYIQYLRDPYMRGYAQPDTQKFTFARTSEDFEFPSLEQVIEGGEAERTTLWELRFAVLSRLRSPHKADLDHIYEVYQRLPEPRMLYLHARFRHQLLRTLGQPDERDMASMLRYFEIIADVKNTGIPLTSAEWNCAIAFASKYVGTVTETEVEAALKLWREMEVDAGIKATNVTFNILFDVACKAGNFTLAEMIYREMESRGHYYNRYHYTSLIHFFGLKNETSGMRAAYREMVNAGEMIDTVVLNAMIGGLLRSGEEGPAEQLYERMKAATLEKETDGSNIPVRTVPSDRAITQALVMFAKIGRRSPSSRAALQGMTLLSPDLQTYRILVNHYGVKCGDLAKAAAFIDEMKFFKIPLHHAIFLALFKGFAHHGGYQRSAWSERRLTGIWNALLDAVDSGAAGLEIKTWLAMWALRAFARCSTRQRTLAVYDALKARWSLNEAEEQFMIDFLSNLVNK